MSVQNESEHTFDFRQAKHRWPSKLTKTHRHHAISEARVAFAHSMAGPALCQHQPLYEIYDFRERCEGPCASCAVLSWLTLGLVYSPTCGGQRNHEARNGSKAAPKPLSNISGPNHDHKLHDPTQHWTTATELGYSKWLPKVQHR